MKNRVALNVQIHLLQNRPDLAAKEAQNARNWAQDSLLVNLAEAWVGLRQVCTVPFHHHFLPFLLPFKQHPYTRCASSR